MRIAVCDDCHESAEKIRNLIGNDYHVTEFLSGKELLQSNRSHPYDMVFLDVEMPEMDGLTVAKELRNQKEDQIVIFISNYDEVVYTAIKLSPLRFIRKSHLEEEFSEAFEAALRVLKNARQEYIISLKGKEWRFLIEEILYIEEKGHYANIHTKNSMVDLRISMKQLSGDLEPYGFLRCHISYLANMSHIQELSSNELLMENGDRIPVSKTYFKKTKESYINYLRRI